MKHYDGPEEVKVEGLKGYWLLVIGHKVHEKIICLECSIDDVRGL